MGTTRTRLRTLLWSLATFCPEAPLAAASEVIKEWDRWLNSRYNAKPTKTRNSCRVAVLPEEWPEVWRAGIPNLDRSMRVGEIRYRRLSPKGRASVIQAVGMMAAARDWAATKDVSLGEAINEDLIEVFARFLLSGREHRACGSDGTPGRGVTPRSAADYLERVRAYVTRSRLIDETGYTTLAEIIGALREEATETDPGKREKVRAFRRKSTLADVVLHAIALAGEAEAFPGHSEAAARRRRDAVVLALLVNTGDRQGDLSRHRIGIDLVRNADGLWETAFRQAKSGRLKDNGSLWRITSQMIDTHILGDRPEWVLPDRLSELHGMNLVSLRSEGLGLYYPSRVLRGAFGISGHLVRTLIVDAIRVSRQTRHGSLSSCWVTGRARCRKSTGSTSASSRQSDSTMRLWRRSGACSPTADSLAQPGSSPAFRNEAGAGELVPLRLSVPPRERARPQRRGTHAIPAAGEGC